MSTTIRPKSENVAKRVIEEITQTHSGKKKSVSSNEFALSARVRALEFEAEEHDLHTSEELKSQLVYARIVLKMPLR